MSFSSNSEVYGATNPSLFSGGHDQDVVRWLEKFKHYSEANGWNELKQHIMIPYYLTGRAKKWYDDNTNKFSNMEQVCVELQKQYPVTNLPILEKVSVKSNETLSNSSEEKNKPIHYKYFTLPMTVVEKIYTFPPPSSISDDFFKLCVVAACTKREVMMDYKKTHFLSNAILLDDYLSAHFVNNGKLNFNLLNLIGNLLLCRVSDNFCDFIITYRQKLKANSIFESDIENSELSDVQKKIITEKFKYFNIENSKLCGYIMNNFMLRCKHDKPLPNISFLQNSATELTDIDKMVFGIDNW